MFSILQAKQSSRVLFTTQQSVRTACEQAHSGQLAATLWSLSNTHWDGEPDHNFEAAGCLSARATRMEEWRAHLDQSLREYWSEISDLKVVATHRSTKCICRQLHPAEVKIFRILFQCWFRELARGFKSITSHLCFHTASLYFAFTLIHMIHIRHTLLQDVHYHSVDKLRRESSSKVKTIIRMQDRVCNYVMWLPLQSHMAPLLPLHKCSISDRWIWSEQATT